MSEQVTLTLPHDVLQDAERWAEHAGRPLNDFLADAIKQSLRPLGAPPASEKPLAAWSDEEVLTAADAMLAEADNRRLSELLYRQQAGLLAGTDSTELEALMQLYRCGLLRKARALREAVTRGLREPLQP